MANKGDPYSRLTEGMVHGQSPDDNPARLPDQENKAMYGQYLKADLQIQNATDDVSGACWGESETYRRLNCRGK